MHTCFTLFHTIWWSRKMMEKGIPNAACQGRDRRAARLKLLHCFGFNVVGAAGNLIFLILGQSCVSWFWCGLPGPYEKILISHCGENGNCISWSNWWMQNADGNKFFSVLHPLSLMCFQNVHYHMRKKNKHKLAFKCFTTMFESEDNDHILFLSLPLSLSPWLGLASLKLRYKNLSFTVPLPHSWFRAISWSEDDATAPMTTIVATSISFTEKIWRSDQLLSAVYYILFLARVWVGDKQSTVSAKVKRCRKHPTLTYPFSPSLSQLLCLTVWRPYLAASKLFLSGEEATRKHHWWNNMVETS